MLITFESLCRKYNIKDITGILHIGAHECEELQAYLANGIKIENIYWVEAMENKVKMMKDRHAGLNIFQALIDLEDNRESPFYITNNGQSSSILEFGSHATNHPHVSVVDNVTLITT